MVKRSVPTSALAALDNRIALLSGPLAYNATHASPTGMFLIRFTSNATVTSVGWAVSWRALPRPMQKVHQTAP